MKGQIYKVLEDTRNEENINSCKLCGSPLHVVVALSSGQYNLSVYRCLTCKAEYFTLSEIYQEM